MKIAKRYLQLMVLMALAFVANSCNDEDDVIDIFTGKTWYMTYIAADGQNRMFDFWQGNEEARIKSIATLQGDNYTLRFLGTELANTVGGTFEGRATSASVGGDWNANGKSRDLRIMIKNGGGTDRDPYLGTAFMHGLKNAIRYGGDNKNLYIYYKDGAGTKFMSFATQRNDGN